MMNESRRIKIIQAINETEKQLIKAEKRYNDTLECIARDEAEGFRVQDDWIIYKENDKQRVDQLKARIKKLDKMLLELVV